jgi:hypothetical protein
MPKLTPLQEVRQRFGSKEELVKQLLPVLERDESAEDDDWNQRIATMSNAKLLRLQRAHEAVKEHYGSKDKLVEALVLKKFPKGNAPYQDKLGRTRSTRLLDLAGVRY